MIVIERKSHSFDVQNMAIAGLMFMKTFASEWLVFLHVFAASNVCLEVIVVIVLPLI